MDGCKLAGGMTRLLIVLATIAAAGPAGLHRQIPVERSPGHLLIDAVAFDRDGSPCRISRGKK